MTAPTAHSVYYVVFCTTIYRDFDDALTRDPELIAAHVHRAKSSTRKERSS